MDGGLEKSNARIFNQYVLFDRTCPITREEVEISIRTLQWNFEIDPIFFKEDFDNLDKGPKFNDDGHDFVEDKIGFGDEGFVIEVYRDTKYDKGVVARVCTLKDTFRHNFTANTKEVELKVVERRSNPWSYRSNVALVLLKFL
ncbi:hypothetical protein Scep_024012 [Stephania cephalantha]|uniref:Uncharacterized protein n=1 Tax=Stephania cephalantha TaxID=152367 RepID=A0AAP0EYM7_9MAGN